MGKKAYFFYLSVAILFSFVVPVLAAQSPAPQTYSLTEVSRLTDVGLFVGLEANVKVYRNGFKELVEVTIASQGDYKGIHMRYLFDLQAHKAYITLVDNNSCSWIRYVSADPPYNYDPIAASTTFVSVIVDSAKVESEKVIGTETVNGISARIVEFSGPPQQGKSRVWIAEKGNFVVKSEVAGPDGNPITLLEIKQLSYSKPPDSLFALPSNCETQTQGEWSSTGWTTHAETSLEVHGSVSANLMTGQPQGEVTAQTSGTTASRNSFEPTTAKASTPGGPPTKEHERVTSVRTVAVRPRPDYKGPYPGKFDFVFSITADGPAEVKYILLNQADRVWQSGTLSFTAAETKEVVLPIKVGVPGKLFEGWAKLQVYSPNRIESEKVPFSVDCRP